ncbi:MAG: EpsI family protein [Armatimonadota bacterium]|nr:EpsI family protein [Armatimonadota bacterium]MDR7439720.1 EpsI family protein [Armatimonadota bacterium]MDR7563220.1 EpsI family protein [Armatimonadota bacterium]MDR7568471.1 EpsI family protein [Armatimonadota bacterium]MDR7602453.1 EpsI family protein [Armatimonadota bacterium]
MSRPKVLAALGSLLLAAVVLQVTLGHVVPLREGFEAFPHRLGPWAGTDEVPEPDALARTRPDAFLSRRYADPEGRSVVLYVAYFARESSRAQIQAACWGSCQVREVRPHRVRVGRSALEVNRAWVVQEGEPAVILYWYQLGGATLRDPYRAKLDQALRVLLKQRSDGALVRVSAPVRSDPLEALGRAENFLRAALPELLRYLPE